MVALQLFDSEAHGLDGSRCNCVKERIGHGLLNGKAAYVQAVHTAALNQIFSRAMVAGS